MRYVWHEGKWVPISQRPHAKTPKTPYVIGDIEPYRPVAGEEAEAFLRKDKKRAKLIGGRKQHREYLKRNNLVEVGNEWDYMTRYGGKTPDNPTRDWGKYRGEGFKWSDAMLERLKK